MDLRQSVTSLSHLPTGRSPRPLSFEEGLWRRSAPSGWGSSHGYLSKLHSYPSMGLEKLHPRMLVSKVNSCGRLSTATPAAGIPTGNIFIIADWHRRGPPSCCTSRRNLFLFHLQTSTVFLYWFQTWFKGFAEAISPSLISHRHPPTPSPRSRHDQSLLLRASDFSEEALSILDLPGSSYNYPHCPQSSW